MSEMVPMYGFGGGSGGSGGTLNVTAPAGVTVTVSKDSKSKTKVADSSGAALFKGLATGEWTLTITDGDRVRTQSVVITADYSAVIAFFAATINITYPAGSACTATDGARTLYAPDTSGVWECVVPNTGTWTITITDGDKSVSKSIEITADGQSENLSISYFSATINVTYPEGSVCTATDGVTTLTAPDTSGIWACEVPNAGTWDFYLNGTKTDSVEIPENGGEKTLSKWYLYNNGVDDTYLTGGLTGDGYSNGNLWSFNSTTISCKPGSVAACFGTNQKISMKNVKTVSVKASITSNKWYVYLFINTNKSVDSYLARGTMTETGVVTCAVDVSDLTDDAYVLIQATASSDMSVNEIWLEY